MNELERRIEKELQTGKKVIVGIDGKCCSGKTALAQNLAMRFDCNVFHLDDFYLQHGFKRPTGMQRGFINADALRFKTQVLTKLSGSDPFVFQKYNCQSDEFIDCEIEQKKLAIVEGTYSLCPELRPFYTIKVFADIEKKLQMERLVARENVESLKQFEEKWLVYEKNYFYFYRIRDFVDIVI